MTQIKIKAQPASRVQVFDPPMCCSTGVCGPNVDPVLPRFAADLEWLKENGITVSRYNLSQQPAAFVANEAVKATLTDKGTECLPLVLVDGEIVSQGAYPERDQFVGWVGLDSTMHETIYSESVAQLVAIGAAIAANCEPCFKFHFNEARKLGVSREDVWRAVETAQAVKDSPSRSVLALARRVVGVEKEVAEGKSEGGCGCTPGSSCC